MKKWKIALSLVVVVFLITLSIVTKNSLDISNAKASSSEIPSFSRSVDQSNPSIALPEAVSATSYDNFDVELVAKLQATYGARIHELNIQARIIKVKEYVLKK
mgnify:FL=1